MNGTLGRRALIAGLMATASGAWANAPTVSRRPEPRPPVTSRLRPRARVDAAEMVAAAGLAGQVGFVIADADSGTVLEQVDAAVPHPPASVMKAVTALYALEKLGPDFRFMTTVYGTAPVVDGRLDGDLILAGGGDPNLLTDQLYSLAESLAATGLVEVTGGFKVWGGALRGVAEIEPGQLDHVGYNPSLSGLNLNFNRVHFEWKRAGSGYTTSMDARSETRRPAVTMARMQIADRSAPLFTYADGGGVDQWTVARRALGAAGSRWLPVRHPELYAGEVFAGFMAEMGVTLAAPQRIAQLPQGEPLAVFRSDPLRETLKDMLNYSTNLTAEVAGLTATNARSGAARGLRTSALGMAQWANERAGIDILCDDHSGLSDASRITAADMVRLLAAPAVRQSLQPILKTIPLTDQNNRQINGLEGRVRAKTGTLNFVSTLAGYVDTTGGRRLAFAIFAADMAQRDRTKASPDEQPAGSISFNTKAKDLQQALLQRWVRLGAA